MTQYIVWRLGLSVLIVIGAMVVLFSFIQFMPGNPAVIMLGPRATPEMVADFRAKMGLDQPLHIQLGNFLLKVFQGDLGTSVLTHRPVSSRILQVIPYTAALAVSTIFLSCLIGIPLGIYSAAYRNTFFDKFSGIVSISFITIPSFVKSIILLLVFAVLLGWFPIRGGGKSGNLLSQLWHLVLPTLSLTLGWVGYLARLTRSSVLEELTEDYIRTARAKGLSERVTVYKHSVRSALIPVVAALGVGFGNLLGGQVLIEIIFHRPGLGFLIFRAINNRDYPMVQGGLIVTVFLYVIVNMLADLVYGMLDPRIRYD